MSVRDLMASRNAEERQAHERYRKQIRDITVQVSNRGIGYLPEWVWENPDLLTHIQEFPRLIDYLALEELNRRRSVGQGDESDVLTRYVRPYVMTYPVFPAGLELLPLRGEVVYSPAFLKIVRESDQSGGFKQRKGDEAKAKMLFRLEQLVGHVSRQRTYDYFDQQTVPGTATLTGFNRYTVGVSLFVSWAMRFLPTDFTQRCFVRVATEDHRWAYVEWTEGKLSFHDGYEKDNKGERVSPGDYLLIFEYTNW